MNNLFDHKNLLWHKYLRYLTESLAMVFNIDFLPNDVFVGYMVQDYNSQVLTIH